MPVTPTYDRETAARGIRFARDWNLGLATGEQGLSLGTEWTLALPNVRRITCERRDFVLPRRLDESG